MYYTAIYCPTGQDGGLISSPVSPFSLGHDGYMVEGWHSGYVKVRLTKFFGFSLGERRLTLTLPVPGPFLTRIITFFTRPHGAV